MAAVADVDGSAVARQTCNIHISYVHNKHCRATKRLWLPHGEEKDIICFPSVSFLKKNKSQLGYTMTMIMRWWYATEASFQFQTYRVKLFSTRSTRSSSSVLHFGFTKLDVVLLNISSRFLLLAKPFRFIIPSWKGEQNIEDIKFRSRKQQFHCPAHPLSLSIISLNGITRAWLTGATRPTSYVSCVVYILIFHTPLDTTLFTHLSNYLIFLSHSLTIWISFCSPQLLRFTIQFFSTSRRGASGNEWPNNNNSCGGALIIIIFYTAKSIKTY